MSERSVHHETVVVERTYEAGATRVFRAWSDPALLARWYTPGDDRWSAKILEHDFRVGGRKRIEFGPPDETYLEDCVYVDIVPDRRIGYAMTVARGELRLTISMVTIELVESGGRCRLRATDQLAVLDGNDSAAARAHGWGETLDKLGPVLAIG